VWVYVGRRLLLAIPTLLGASVIVFAMVHLAPGDPIAAVMPAESSAAEIEATKRAYGFDRPLPVQYLVWLQRVAQGDLGRSIATRRPVILDVRDALANSLVLALSSSLLAFVVGIALGLLSGVIEAGYFILLSAAYRRGDLSVVYPIARGTAPLLTAGASTLIVGEALGLAGWLGIALLATGVLLMSLRGGRDMRLDRRAIERRASDSPGPQHLRASLDARPHECRQPPAVGPFRRRRVAVPRQRLDQRSPIHVTDGPPEPRQEIECGGHEHGHVRGRR